MKAVLLPLLLLMFATTAHGQRAQLELTDQAIDRAIAFYNEPTTVRIIGDSRIAPEAELPDNVAVLEGVLQVDGRVRGGVLVINGELRLGRGAVISGPVMLIGGLLIADDSAPAIGELSIYRGTFSYRLDDGVLSRIEPQRPGELAAGREFDFGRTDIVASAGQGYNRVEGLPMVMGPRLTLGRSNPTILEVLGIYRSATGVTPDFDELGYTARVEQYLGGYRAARIGLRAYDQITYIESTGISDRENSLASFVLHEDHRDHYEREGWAAFLRLGRPGRPGTMQLEYRDERHKPVRARRPLSIIDNDDVWRPEALAATGTLRTVAADVSWDTRNHVQDPSTGWWLRAGAEAGLGGSLHYVGGTDASAPTRFTTAEFDIRRYARLGPGSRLALRVYVAGSLNGNELPVQRQHALGGEGSLPGYTLREFDCGATTQVTRFRSAAQQLFYGCDRVALVQVEHQGDFSVLRGLGNRNWFGLLERVRWVAFFDAGRAWNEAEAAGVRTAGADDFAADGGFGLKLGPVGVYWAVPLSARADGVNFFVRLGNRL